MIINFVKYMKDSMCTTLSCRKSVHDTKCEHLAGVGAAEGTTCGSGKVILRQGSFYTQF